ncbi:lunapark protein [Rutstroemia sp. NJR-2017a WRK4]|nr:lunapark protein [Rutstroemia sp. NJR-2017a WRK4]
MVSIWPWKREDNSPASFEKTLAALADKISKSQALLESRRLRGRRVKALWTLYSSFAYLVVFVIVLLVIGWKNLSALEYTGLAGSPLVIYLIRSGITSYYNYRVESIARRVEEQQAERAKTIDKLKAATRYNSTQELLEKYGGVPPKPAPPKRTPSVKKTSKDKPSQPARVNMGPPATANIPRPNQIPSQPSTPQPLMSRTPPPPFNAPSPAAARGEPGPPEFAPNAFSAPPQFAQGSDLHREGHWYDRVLDLLLGEDETLPKNRTAMICQNCRLVNGQAPPGTKSLAELGKWRCYGCRAWNGEEDEAAKAVKEMKEIIQETKASEPFTSGSEHHSTEPEDTPGSEDLEHDEPAIHIKNEDDSEEEKVDVQPKKGRPKSTRKKA